MIYSIHLFLRSELVLLAARNNGRSGRYWKMEI